MEYTQTEQEALWDTNHSINESWPYRKDTFNLNTIKQDAENV